VNDISIRQSNTTVNDIQLILNAIILPGHLAVISHKGWRSVTVYRLSCWISRKAIVSCGEFRYLNQWMHACP